MRHPLGPDRIIVTIPIQLVSEANSRDHHMAKHRRVKSQRKAVWAMLFNELIREVEKYRVTLTRIAPRLLDTDNRNSSMKAVRDETAKWLGRDDAPSSGIEWVYDQRKGEPRQYAVEIEVEAL
jgi:hypothetical protein